MFFFFFIPLLVFILLGINFAFAPHNPYQEKNGAFECGYTSFLGQNRTQFSISFFIFALLFLLFDLEILLVYPYLVSSYNNESYGLAILLIFLAALTLGFVFELGKKALSIDSKQTIQIVNNDLHMNKAMIISQGIDTALLSYILNILFQYIFKLLISHFPTFRQPRLVNLSMLLIMACFTTLLFDYYQGCYNDKLHSIIITLIIA